MQRLPHVQFTNLYGPTEATIASSYFTVKQCPESPLEQIPIGQACDGEELMVLDSELQPAAVGVPGDLFIAGVGLSPGYWQDREKTDQAFLIRRGADHVQQRIYRTGDLACVDDDGMFYYLGRTDSQIKSRGYRIELGEIETAMNALGNLRDCAVVGVPTGGFEGTAICCAYVPQADVDVSPESLRTQASKLLPKYMLPRGGWTFRNCPRMQTERPTVAGSRNCSTRRLRPPDVTEKQSKTATPGVSEQEFLDSPLAPSSASDVAGKRTSVRPMQTDSDSDLTTNIRQLFADHLAIEVPNSETDLIESGLLDSLAMVDLLVHLEREFKFTVVMDELDVEDFRCVQRIADYVLRCRD